MRQTSHAIRRNYPVLGNMRYIMETIRPELRQYIVESDTEGAPYDRLRRAQIYQRAKNINDTLPFGTRRNVYAVHHEWACHSMWPKEIVDEDAKRSMIGTSAYGTTKPYSASVLNISAMSYGAISDNAILALNRGAKLGNFYHNTGEGGVSKHHKDGGGDIVWNVGTGYFGCGSGHTRRVFEPTQLSETVEECDGRIKMIEIKISQGAKPGHGGLLPKAKITKEIANARKLKFPPEGDCHSPPYHSAFSNPHELVEFIATVRELAGGIPVGIKICPGQPGEVASLCKAMLDVGNGPDFITVDGAEGKLDWGCQPLHRASPEQ
jgi:glutamate synthase domain-containing protein 2